MADRSLSSVVQDLKSWCTTHRVKGTELAVMLGVSQQAVSEWFRGKSHPSGKKVVRILEMIKGKPPPGNPTARKPRKPAKKRKKLEKVQTVETDAETACRRYGLSM